MAVMRIHKNRNYTVISNVHLRDRRMSLKAKGLLTLMLSLPDDWDYSVAGLVTQCKESKTAVQSTLKELERCGYLKRTMEHNEKGQFECIYEIFEVPQETDQPENPPEQNTPTDGSADFCPPVTEEPQHEDRCTEPVTENQSRLTLYKQNTDNQLQKQNTEIKNTENEKICLAVITHLNEVTGASYRAETKKTQSLIEARLGESYQLEDFMRVIDKKHREWSETEFARYLRPITLFGEKFESYLNAPETARKQPQKPPAPNPKAGMREIIPGIF